MCSGICPERLYRLTELKRMTMCDSGFFRKARREGLTVYYCGRQAWVMGKDMIEYITTQGKTERC